MLRLTSMCVDCETWQYLHMFRVNLKKYNATDLLAPHVVGATAYINQQKVIDWLIDGCGEGRSILLIHELHVSAWCWQSNCVFRTTATCTACRRRASPICSTVSSSTRRCPPRVAGVAWTAASSRSSARSRWTSAVCCIRFSSTSGASPAKNRELGAGPSENRKSAMGRRAVDHRPHPRPYSGRRIQLPGSLYVV